MEPLPQDINQCSKCKQNRSLDCFKFGCKQCITCLEAKRRYRQNHKEQVADYNKKYYQEHKEEQAEKLKTMYIECFYCGCRVHEYAKKRHVNTNKHKRNMEEFHNQVKKLNEMD